MHKLQVFGIVAVLGAILVLGCGRPSTTIHIGVRTANDHVPFYISDREGLYRTQGLSVTTYLVPSNTEIVEALQRGDFQVGAVPVTTAITAIDQGAQLRIIAMTGRGSDGLLVRQDSGIRTWADLRGKQIATIKTSILDILLRQALEENGLDPDRDVTLVYFQKLGDMISALQTGQVDATSNTEPFMTDAVRQGWGSIVGYYTEQWPDHPCCVVVAREDFIRDHAGELDTILRCHIESVERANADPDYTAAVIVAYLKSFDTALVKASLATDKMRVDYRFTEDEIARMARLMQAQGLLEHAPESLHLTDTGPLARALGER
jgi:NitT/TauT family transport system substrate-binding protein